MVEVLRSWMCLNQRCCCVFDAWEENPACPSCGCVRVQWVPGGGHVGKMAGSVDAEVRSLADSFGLSDLKAAKRGEAVKVMAQAPAAPGRPMQFAPGFAAPIDPTRAQCVPSSQPVNFKARVGTGQSLSPNTSMPRLSSNTRVEAKHTG